jgi:hypothetical protein
VTGTAVFAIVESRDLPGKINHTTLGLAATSQAIERPQNETQRKGGNAVNRPRAADDFATIKAAWRSCAVNAREPSLARRRGSETRQYGAVGPSAGRRQRSAKGQGGYANLAPYAASPTAGLPILA